MALRKTSHSWRFLQPLRTDQSAALLSALRLTILPDKARTRSQSSASEAYVAVYTAPDEHQSCAGKAEGMARCGRISKAATKAKRITRGAKVRRAHIPRVSDYLTFRFLTCEPYSFQVGEVHSVHARGVRSVGNESLGSAAIEKARPPELKFQNRSALSRGEGCRRVFGARPDSADTAGVKSSCHYDNRL